MGTQTINAELSPYRKRSFNPDDDVAELIYNFEQKCPGSILTHQINEGLRKQLSEYQSKRGIPAKLRKP